METCYIRQTPDRHIPHQPCRAFLGKLHVYHDPRPDHIPIRRHYLPKQIILYQGRCDMGIRKPTLAPHQLYENG
jgi:hypothetical protein